MFQKTVIKNVKMPPTLVFFFALSCVEMKRNSTCRFKSHPHLVGAHGARFVQVKLPEYGLAW